MASEFKQSIFLFIRQRLFAWIRLPLAFALVIIGKNDGQIGDRIVVWCLHDLTRGLVIQQRGLCTLGQHRQKNAGRIKTTYGITSRFSESDKLLQITISQSRKGLLVELTNMLGGIFCERHIVITRAIMRKVRANQNNVIISDKTLQYLPN